MSPFGRTNRRLVDGAFLISGGNMKALWDSIVRTLTPIIVGAVVGFAVANGIELDPQFELALIGVITAGAQGIYYIGVRLLERYVSPKFGWLLGLAKEPVYVPGVSLRRDSD